MALVRIQAAENLSFEAACERGAVLLDINNEKFQMSIQAEGERRYKSRHFKEMNKAIAKISKEKYSEGYKRGMDVAHFTVPCNRCGRSMNFSDYDRNWLTEIKPKLKEAFRDWVHNKCPEKGMLDYDYDKLTDLIRGLEKYDKYK